MIRDNEVNDRQTPGYRLEPFKSIERMCCSSFEIGVIVTYVISWQEDFATIVEVLVHLVFTAVSVVAHRQLVHWRLHLATIVVVVHLYLETKLVQIFY